MSGMGGTITNGTTNPDGRTTKESKDGKKCDAATSVGADFKEECSTNVNTNENDGKGENAYPTNPSIKRKAARILQK